MQVGVRVFRHVIVEDDVDTLNVHATSEQIRCHKNAFLEVLELLVAIQAAHTDRDSFTWLTEVLRPTQHQIGDVLPSQSRGLVQNNKT